MADIALLGYRIDSSGLVEGTKALDENAAAAEKVSGATDRLERYHQALARTVERSSSVLGDRLGGALDRIGTGTGAVITELQTLNRTNAEIQASLAALDGKLANTAGGLQTMGTASRAAATAETQVATASQQLEQQLAQQDARLRGVSERAMEWARANREANLSERALAEAARDAALGIDHKARVMARAGSEQERMAARAQALQQAEERSARETRAAAAATEARRLNLQQLLGQINPTVAALNRLADQEDRLARARDLGLLKPQVYQQYQAQLDATRASLLTTTNSVGRLNLQTVEAQQSIVMLARSLASGDLMTAQSSITSLTSRTGALAGAFTATGLVAGGTAAAIVAVGVAAAKGYMEMRDLDRVIIGMGGSAGALTGSLMNVRNEIGRMTGEYGNATQAITQVIQSGKVLSDNAATIASAATSIASLTGQSIGSVTSSILDMVGGSTEALAKLNSQYGFLTVASFNHIEAVREEKGETAALQLALVELERAQGDRVRSMQASAGVLERAWRGVKGEILDAIQAFKNIGRTDIEQQLQEAIWKLHNVRATTFGNPLNSERYMEARAEVSRLLGERMEMQDKEWADERKRRLAQEVIETQAAAKAETAAASESINAQLAGLDRVSSKLVARNKIIELYNKLSANDPRQFDGSMQRLIANSDAEIDKRFNRSGGNSQPNKDAESLAKAYQSINDQMAQQIALYGDTSRVAATRYQLERGNLRGLRSDLADVLIAQAAQLDAQTRQKDATQALTRLQSELNRQEKSGLAVAQERLRVLNEAKGEGVISDGDYNSTLAKIVSAGPEAPKITGVDALFGGSSGELAKLDQQRAALEEWYGGQLQLLDAFRQSEASVNAIYDEQALADRQAYADGLSQIDRARQNVMLATAEQGFAAVADLMRTSFSEQSALYKAAFVVQKAAAIAQATLAIQTGIAEAAKNPWPANLAAMASVAAATAGLVSNIAAVGMAHDGIDSVPREGTWLLDKGERVLTAGTAAKMDATLERISSSGAVSGNGAGGNVYAPVINVAGDPDQRTLQALKSLLAQERPVIINQARTIIGGDLATGAGVVGRGMKRGYVNPRRVS
ncbi:phage tail length tape measure family protein [Stenotrophomonas sp. GD03680]|uniref:phage tail length tape measure family protein n=1 Tax=Stenotrophomonas sp. GD03680 TaxID=2975365 RepID=UPI002447677F|nr:phage tail length tape measure family protein [Stenotrophomonas sp. GD03680]MDH2021229.1 phage tail length tape measure family protein [Stenotrophomonas sp. GD03680]